MNGDTRTVDAADVIERLLGERPLSVARLASGHTGPIVKARLPSGADIVVKLAAGAAVDGDALLREARMLTYLRERHAPVPQVLASSPSALAMEHIEGAPGSCAQLADVLLALHDVTAARFGFDEDTVIGGLPQRNPWSASWPRFFADHRLLALLPTDHASLARRIERLAARIGDVVDAPDAPRLAHGDLWTGNILVRDGRVAALIDPALAYVDAELDLALLELFGCDAAVFTRYFERRPPRPGRRERAALYRLWPLLVHVRLFGGSYVGDVDATLRALGF